MALKLPPANIKAYLRERGMTRRVDKEKSLANNTLDGYQEV